MFISFVGIMSILGGVILGVRLAMASRLNLHIVYWIVTATPIAVGLVLLIWPEQSLQLMVAVAITCWCAASSNAPSRSRTRTVGWELLPSTRGIALCSCSCPAASRRWCSSSSSL